jgi:hypothetical protein
MKFFHGRLALTPALVNCIPACGRSMGKIQVGIRTMSSNSNTGNIFDTMDFLNQFATVEPASASEAALFTAGRASGALHEATVREALSSMKGGTLCAMKLRNAAMNARDKTLSGSLKNYLEAAFSRDTLEFRRVTFEGSTGLMLERVAEKDSVLAKIRTLRELKKRLGDGRRCYALLHPDLPDDPVAFIHVALTQELAGGLPYLDQHCREHPSPNCAMFYSVNSPHAALGGLDLATKIIKLAAAEVGRNHPSVRTFCTLSPIPGFMSWLAAVGGGSASLEGTPIVLPSALQAQLATAAGSASTQWLSETSDVSRSQRALRFLHSAVSDFNWIQDENLVAQLRPSLEWLGRRYLAHEKQQGAPLDPVGRFHLRNGASLHRLNWMGNPSVIGLSRSAGLMVNYLYDLGKLKERALAFPNVHVGDSF